MNQKPPDRDPKPPDGDPKKGDRRDYTGSICLGCEN